MNFTIDAAIASVITAIIVGLISLLTTNMANRNSLRQYQAQSDSAERIADREAQIAEKEREIERQKNLVFQLQEMYGNSIANLTALLPYAYSQNYMKDPTCVRLIGDAHKSLSFIVAFYYDKNSKDFSEFLKCYRDSGVHFDATTLSKLREMVINFASKDPRM